MRRYELVAIDSNDKNIVLGYGDRNHIREGLAYLRKYGLPGFTFEMILVSNEETKA